MVLMVVQVDHAWVHISIEHEKGTVKAVTFCGIVGRKSVM